MEENVTVFAPVTLRVVVQFCETSDAVRVTAGTPVKVVVIALKLPGLHNSRTI